VSKSVWVVSLFGLGLLAVATMAKPARAAYILNIDEVGSNVVASGSGTIDLTDLSLYASGVPTNTPEAIPIDAEIKTGAAGPLDVYQGFSGPNRVVGPNRFGFGNGLSA